MLTLSSMNSGVQPSCLVGELSRSCLHGCYVNSRDRRLYMYRKFRPGNSIRVGGSKFWKEFLIVCSSSILRILISIIGSVVYKTT